MTILINRPDLLSALTRLSGVVTKRNTLEILSSVLIETQADSATFHATNLDLEASVTVPAKCDPAQVCVDADKLLSIAKNAAEGAEVSMEAKERLIVKSGRSRFQLSLGAPKDFPTFAGLEPDVSISLPAPQLLSLLSRVAYSAAPDNSQPLFNSVALVSDERGLWSAATNGKRAAIFTTDIQAPPFSILIPLAAVREFERQLSGHEGDATLSLSKAKAQVTAGLSRLTSKLIDGNAPDYWKPATQDFTRTLVVNRDLAATMIRRASIVIDDKSKSGRLLVKDGCMSLAARSQYAEEAQDEIEVEYDGPEIALGVNSQNMLEAIVAADSEDVEIAFTDNALRPMRVRAVGDDRWQAVVMPLVA